MTSNTSEQKTDIDINKVFLDFDHANYWKILIDKAYWSLNNPRIFDQQSSPGYLQNTTTALLYMLQTINNDITIDYIISLHDIAYHEKNSKLLGLKSYGISTIKLEAVTEDGIEELIAKIKNASGKLSLHYSTQKNSQFNDDNIIDVNVSDTSILAKEILEHLESKDWYAVDLARISTISDAAHKIKELLVQYKRSIQDDDDETKLYAIAKFICDIHQYHPFEDGNGRTFIFLLLNKLLIMNGFEPTIISVPGKFSAHGIRELVKEIKNGQDVFKSLKTETEIQQTTIIDYLINKIDTDHADELFIFIDNEIANLYRDYNVPEVGEYLKTNLQMIFEKVVSIYDNDTLDLVFNKTPPDNIALKPLFLSATQAGNIWFIHNLIKFAKSKNLTLDLNERDLIVLFHNFDSKEVKSIFDQLVLTSKEKFRLLIYPHSFGFSQNHILFRNLLTTRKTEITRHLLDECLDQEFIDLMRHDMRGINALQLLALFDKDYFDKCYDRLRKLDVNVRQIMSQKITTTYEAEKNQIKKTRLLDEGFYSDSPSALFKTSSEVDSKHQHEVRLTPLSRKP